MFENKLVITKVISLSYEERENKTNRDLRLQDRVNKFLFEEVCNKGYKFEDVRFDWNMWNAVVIYSRPYYTSETGV